MNEQRSVLRIGDRVIYAGQCHTVVAFSGATIRLLSDSGETTLVALGYLLSAEDFELIGADRAPKVDPVGLLESLPQAVVEAAREWERHLVEIDTGVAPGSPAGTRPRPQYDPDTLSVTARCRAKAAELTAAGTKTSFRTVQRMRARYRDQGLWGLVDTRSARGRKPTGNVDERAHVRPNRQYQRRFARHHEQIEARLAPFPVETILDTRGPHRRRPGRLSADTPGARAGGVLNQKERSQPTPVAVARCGNQHVGGGCCASSRSIP